MDEILKYAVENGMIDLSHIQECIEMGKRKELLEKHPYKIWQGRDGNWYTHLPDKTKAEKRRLVRKGSKEAVENEIIAQAENPTVRQLFDEWISDKARRKEIEPSTVDRYKRQFEECFTAIADRKASMVTEYDIEKFIKDVIYDHNLTTKGFSNMRTLVYGIFKLAKKKRLVNYSITQVVQDIEISRKAFRRKVEDKEKEVFSTDELPGVIEYLTNNKDIINLGILLVFKSGLRVGELAALKMSDIDFRSGEIHVCRTETRYEVGNTAVYEVRDFPKTEAGIRNILLPDSCIWILKEIRSKNPFGEYLFENKGERIRTYVFRDRLRYICRHLGIVVKTPHKARKTYGTMLLNSGAEESLIISQMGHTDIKTTKKYYYKDRLSDDEKRNAIEHAIGF